MSGLDGVRVLELGGGVAAAATAKLLSDLGADVIKVEPPEGDPARRRGPFPAGAASGPERSGLFLALNTNKRSVVAGELAGPGVAALVAEADVVVHNLTAPELAAAGLDPGAWRAAHPRLVVASITPFGLTGPYAAWRAEELTINHGGGWGWLGPGASPDPDLPPLKAWGHQADLHAGLVAATAVLGCVHKARRTGEGAQLDLSAMAHVAGMLEAAYIGWSYQGEDASRLGSRIRNPWGIFPCSDGLIFLVSVEADQWERLVDMMGRPEWAEMEIFTDFPDRLANDDLLRIYLGEWTAQHTVAELWHEGQARRICFAPVFTMADLAGQDHLRQRGFFVDVEHPEAGRVTHLGAPFVLGRPWWGLRAAAPTLGQHTGETFTPRSSVPAVVPGTGERGRRPLDGVRVADLSWVWAGPYCTMHLAHLGADVIKIESAARPTLGRRLPIHPPEVEPTLDTCGYFNQWEQGKRSCTVDLSHAESREVVLDIIAHCDVVVSNFATGVMDRLGFTEEALRARNPDVVIAAISGYGQSGPLSHYMGYGPTTGPLSGLTSLTGHAGGPPEELGISVGDPGAGITAAFAIAAALVARQQHGGGQTIDVALWESTAANALEGWMHHALTGVQPERMGNRDPLMAPHNVYRCAGDDRWVAIACATDAEWAALAAVVDAERGGALAGDPRFATAEGRKAHEDELDEGLAAWCAGRDRWDVTRALQAVGVAAFPSMTPSDLDADPHLAARGFIERLDHPAVGRRGHTGVPWLLDSAPNGVMGPAPLLGQHTEDVLAEVAGYSAERIAALRAAGLLA